ncbi:hypothetical protein PanWU01x14_140590 [Parasponia andersonii]|uniref:Transmembrane protein n=1 Tax=Parasponia andersonii TaxID=3476 RepID=A0A2P5CM25_PARAD|nr:hypothetical protein PanWU01x14_140590 [Parasponia andersonii]
MAFKVGSDRFKEAKDSVLIIPDPSLFTFFFFSVFSSSASSASPSSPSSSSSPSPDRFGFCKFSILFFLFFLLSFSLFASTSSSSSSTSRFSFRSGVSEGFLTLFRLRFLFLASSSADVWRFFTGSAAMIDQ